MARFGRLAALAAILLVAACGPKDNLIVVLPSADGHIGGVAIHDAAGTTLLDKPYAAAEADRGASRVATGTVGSQQVRQIFQRALAARPIPPKSFRLYFLEGSDEMTPDSRQAFEAVFQDIARRPAAEVMVVGHTDTVGSLTDNDALGFKRAQAIRTLLISRGLAPDSVGAAGRGKRELLVPTGDQVPEPRNRRVEIIVR